MKLAARMQKIKKEWLILEQKPEKARQLAMEAGISPVVAQILLNRQIHDAQKAKEFLFPKLGDLIVPEEMPGIEAAIERIERAVRDKEKVTIYGDYDVDGITATSIMWQLLRILGCDADFYIPHRIDEGYGLNCASIRELAENGTKLIITVDCGITAVEEAELAYDLGMEIVITDHHEPKEVLPKSHAIVHPKLDPAYQGQDSAGAMVAFKLAWAISNRHKAKTDLYPALREFLLDATNFAAMGTIADVVDLRGENRSLTHYGLRSIGCSQLPGIQALLDISGLKGKTLDSQAVAFMIAPMLNAAGRMGHARLAVELLTSDNELRSMRIVDYLKKQNLQRQQIERKIFKQAGEMITSYGYDHPDRKSIVLADEDWHQGVVGIVASRIIEKHYRPTILLNSSNGTSVGSARSVEGFNILEAIKACSQHLIGFGGHAMAAGLTIETSKIPDFTEAFEEYAKANLNDEDTVSRLEIDGVFPIGMFNEKVVSQIDKLGPFGKGNPSPVFASRGVRLLGKPRTVGSKNDHLQFAVSDSSGSVRCIGFRMGSLEKKVVESDFFSIAYEPQINNFNGVNSVQFVVNDIQFD